MELYPRGTQSGENLKMPNEESDSTLYGHTLVPA